MGLDMYLAKKRYVKNWDHMKPEEKHSIVIKKNGKTIADEMPITYIEYEAGYWRKANAIHKWFIDNCVGTEEWHGDDVYVSREQLQTLLTLCKKVLATAVIKQGQIQNGSVSDKDENGNFIMKPNMQAGEYIENDEEIAGLLPTESGFFFGSTDYNEFYLDDIKQTITIIENCLKDTECSFYYSASW